MIDWLKNRAKEYPEFWKNYLKKFDQKSKKFVVLNLDTTGLDSNKDVILAMGAITVENNQICIGSTFEAAIPQYHFFHKNDMLEPPSYPDLPKMVEPIALESFLQFIENATLVGHRINFDIDMINVALEKMGCGNIKNETLDIEIMHKKFVDIDDKNFSIDQIAAHYKIPTSESQSTSNDAYILSIIFLRLKQKLGIK